jgi:hypothetical protein
MAIAVEEHEHAYPVNFERLSVTVVVAPGRVIWVEKQPRQQYVVASCSSSWLLPRP